MYMSVWDRNSRGTSRTVVDSEPLISGEIQSTRDFSFSHQPTDICIKFSNHSVHRNSIHSQFSDLSVFDSFQNAYGKHMQQKTLLTVKFNIQDIGRGGGGNRNSRRSSRQKYLFVLHWLQQSHSLQFEPGSCVDLPCGPIEPQRPRGQRQTLAVAQPERFQSK